MNKIIGGLFYLVTLACISCTEKKINDNRSIVTMNSFTTDSTPFFSYLRIQKLAKDTSIEVNGKESNKAFLYKLFLLDNVRYWQDTSTELLPSVLFIEGRFDNKTYFMFDSNNDRNFTKEKTYEYLPENNGYIEIKNISFYLGKQKYTKSFFVKPIKVNLNYDGGTDRPEEIAITALPIYRTGIIEQANQHYKLALFNSFYTEYTNENSSLIITQADKPFQEPASFPVKYRVGDTFYLNKQIYVFENTSKSGDSIYLTNLGELSENYGITDSTFALREKFNNVFDGHPYEIGGSKKYTLIDFWGTWCLPCLELTDELIKIDKEFHGKNFEIVSIAYDNSSDNVLKYLKSKKINWVNGFDDRNNSIIIDKFKVRDFPTFILLDEDGRIIKRGVGKQALFEIKKILQSTIGQPK